MRSFAKLGLYHDPTKTNWGLKALACLILMCIAALGSRVTAANEQKLTVAVASNFYFPLTQIIEGSPRWNVNNLKLVSGSSGVLYAQSMSGAPFDIFLSADAARPQALFEQGMSQAPISYAQGKLVLWPADKALSAEQNLASINGRIAIANPKTAPFGAAANTYLKSLSIYPELSTRLVYGNNISQTFQFIDTGNAAIGLIAQSMLIQAQNKFPNKGEHYALFSAIPLTQYPNIIQQGVVLSKEGSDNFKLATEFMAFLLSSEVQKQLTELGYLSPVQNIQVDKQGDN